MKKIILLTFSHGIVAVLGFAIGIYMLPILTAPKPPSGELMTAAIQQSLYEGIFRRDLKGSDFFHWGEGKIVVGPSYIALDGEVAPGPDYKLYLSPEFVESEAEFNRIKSHMALVGDVKTFQNFVISVPSSIDIGKYNTVVVWCESFGEFISAARYQ